PEPVKQHYSHRIGHRAGTIALPKDHKDLRHYQHHYEQRHRRITISALAELTDGSQFFESVLTSPKYGSGYADQLDDEFPREFDHDSMFGNKRKGMSTMMEDNLAAYLHKRELAAKEFEGVAVEEKKSES